MERKVIANIKFYSQNNCLQNSLSSSFNDNDDNMSSDSSPDSSDLKMQKVFFCNKNKTLPIKAKINKSDIHDSLYSSDDEYEEAVKKTSQTEILGIDDDFKYYNNFNKPFKSKLSINDYKDLLWSIKMGNPLTSITNTNGAFSITNVNSNKSKALSEIHLR